MTTGRSLLAAACLLLAAGAPQAQTLPARISEIMNAPKYAGAVWGLRVTDLDSGATLASLGPDTLFFTGSVRKLFSVGSALNALGAGHQFRTPAYATGTLNGGVLDGDLVIVADGDLTLGGRDDGAGGIAFTDFDHTEANWLGSAILTEGDPLAGVVLLARQVAAAGVTRITGDVVVDDRLFVPFVVPNGKVLITPAIVNDNLIDVTILPTAAGQPAKVDWRPKSAGFTVRSEVTTAAAGAPTKVTLTPVAGGGVVSGTVAIDYAPALPGVPTLVKTFTIPDPSAYLRTVFIAALTAAGVAVAAPAVGPNPADRLPDGYADATRLGELVSPGYAQYARLILKVSHNTGANLSLMLHGLTRGARTIDAALAAERQVLVADYGLPADGFDFPTNGSGSPDSRATPDGLLRLLEDDAPDQRLRSVLRGPAGAGRRRLARHGRALPARPDDGAGLR